MKIVINDCFGGFELSDKALEMLGLNEYDYIEEEERNRADLVKVVEMLGDDANGDCAELKVVEIPDTATDWEINEYDGNESIIYVVDGKIKHAF